MKTLSVREKLARVRAELSQPERLARVLAAVAAVLFWILAAKLHSAEALLIAGGMQMVLLGARDMTYGRFRVGVDVAQQFGMGLGRMLAAALAIDALTLLARAMLMVAAGYAIAAVLPGSEKFLPAILMALPFLPFWSRETLFLLARHYEVQGAMTFSSLGRHLAGLALLIWLPVSADGGIETVVLAVILREGVAVVVILLCLVLGALGLYRSTEGYDDADGAQMNLEGYGEAEASLSLRRRIFIDNFIWSRWRWFQFASRQLASGALGPLGNLSARLVFAFRQPSAAAARSREEAVARSRGKKLLQIVIAVLVASAAIAYCWYNDLLSALSFAAIAFVLRTLALRGNYAFWTAVFDRTGEPRPA